MQERNDLRRGDSFDIGDYQPIHNNPDIQALISNPSKLISSLNLTSKQAENIRALVMGAGTAGIYRLLSKHLGNEVSGAIGGLISGYIAGKLIK